MPRGVFGDGDADLGEQRLERREAGRDAAADQQLLGRVAVALEPGRAIGALGGREVVRRPPRRRGPRAISASPRRSSTRRRSSASRGIDVERGAPQLGGLIERVRGLAALRGLLGVARGALGQLGEQEVAQQQLRIARLVRRLERERDARVEVARGARG